MRDFDPVVTINQMGGQGKLRAMVGAEFYTNGTQKLTIRFKGSRKYNTLEITLNFMDLYNMRFGQVGKNGFKEKKVIEDVYNDMLKPIFEQTTGLYLSL